MSNYTNSWGDPPPPMSPPQIEPPVNAMDPSPIVNTEEEDPVEELTNVSEPEDTGDDWVEDEDSGIEFSRDHVDLRGIPIDHLVSLLKDYEDDKGISVLHQDIRIPGTWANIVVRSLTSAENSNEELRIREVFELMTEEEKQTIGHRLIDPETGKAVLRASSINPKHPSPGETKNLSGFQAMMAFENFDKNGTSGGYKVPLYNSGIIVDIISPTGVDIQTMFLNCRALDRELGVSQGAHYFAFADQLLKTEVLRFIEPLIVNSTYNDWKRNGKLWSLIKLPDLATIVMSVAACCFKDGFDNFTMTCSQPAGGDPKSICGHTETISANLFEMMLTRWPVIPKEQIEFLAKSRAVPFTKNTLAEIASYQSGLGFEGRKITVADTIFHMKIPTVAEHLDAGAQFLADIRNEISADNTSGQYEAVGIRYMRSFLPWISAIEKTDGDGGSIKTSDEKVILRILEKLDNEAEEYDIRKELRKYIDEVQLTYIGWPSVPCSKCGKTVDTPSGMLTFDPFSAFFTIVLQYLKRGM